MLSSLEFQRTMNTCSPALLAEFCKDMAAPKAISDESDLFITATSKYVRRRQEEAASPNSKRACQKKHRPFLGRKPNG